MAFFGASDWLVRFLLQRALTLCYLVAFRVAARQFSRLAGLTHGIWMRLDY